MVSAGRSESWARAASIARVVVAAGGGHDPVERASLCSFHAVAVGLSGRAVPVASGAESGCAGAGEPSGEGVELSHRWVAHDGEHSSEHHAGGPPSEAVHDDDSGHTVGPAGRRLEGGRRTEIVDDQGHVGEIELADHRIDGRGRGEQRRLRGRWAAQAAAGHIEGDASIRVAEAGHDIAPDDRPHADGHEQECRSSTDVGVNDRGSIRLQGSEPERPRRVAEPRGAKGEVAG